MKNIKLTIEYDGTCYAGWQRQQNDLAVQQVIEEALERLTGEKIVITGASRTDSGVHARGQAANFYTDATIPPERYCFALNSVLPGDIRIIDSSEVDMDFHARYLAKGKRYKYAMISGPHGTAIGSRYLYHVPYSLDIEKMKIAAQNLLGTHDFCSFQAAGASVKSTVRTVFNAKLEAVNPYLFLTIEGDGFLYNMIRIIVGTLIYIGIGKIKPEDMIAIIDSRDRKLAGPTAPPHGLFLEEVYY